MHAIDAGTVYSDTTLTSRMSAGFMVALFKTIWNHLHGALLSFPSVQKSQRFDAQFSTVLQYNSKCQTGQATEQDRDC